MGGRTDQVGYEWEEKPGQPRFSAWAFSAQQYMQDTQLKTGGGLISEIPKWSLGGGVV